MGIEAVSLQAPESVLTVSIHVLGSVPELDQELQELDEEEAKVRARRETVEELARVQRVEELKIRRMGLILSRSSSHNRLNCK